MKKIKLEESLLYAHSELAEEWHSERNKGLLPSQVKPKSNKKAWWQCRKNELHVWDAVISSRPRNGCPFCSGQRVHITNCLATLNPQLAKEWHPTLNDALTPFDFTFKSSKTVWWQCPQNESHEWNAPISRRGQGEGCPYCSGRKVNDSNSLATLLPFLAEEWHPVLNKELSPNDVTTGSNKHVYWRCRMNEDHVWETSIVNRSRGRNCPDCKRESKTSFPEQAIFFYVKQAFPDAKNRYIFDAKAKKNVEIDIFIPSLNFAIEYDGSRHKDLERDLKKNKILIEENVKMVRVRVADIPEMTHEDIGTFIHQNDNNVSLKNCLTEIGSYLTSTYRFVEKTKRLVEKWNEVDIERDRFTIYQQYITSLKGNSISNLRSDLLEEWDYVRNKGLNPEYVSISSNKRVNWICKKKESHKWKATVNSRTCNKGTGCGYCSNNKLDPDGSNSFAARFPEIAGEWHPTKNGDLMPSDVLPGTHKKVWWLCKKHPLHEWDASVDSRAKSQGGKNCPFCAGFRVNSSNSLATLYPNLAQEWHPTKNGELTPNDVTVGSNKKVWWQCRGNREHEWDISPNQRAGKQKTGCPFCSNRRVDIHNCLQTTHPHLVKEWHPTKNGDLTPKDVTKGSHKKVWWMKEKNGQLREWEARIDSRK